ncbi:Zn(2)-C6 fungal-type domain-containing protein [Mycena kentingensis (nom. inval.)]|nr:Zn(2)-C6 fungal-type domain-containing protein [Mycena kentingensis (nom. inval.)]
MSDDEAVSPPQNRPLKQRRPDRSCDLCRRRKIRCTLFVQVATCDHNTRALHPAKKRGPKSKIVEELKAQNALLEAKLRALSVCSLCAQPLPDAPFTGDSSASIFSSTGSPGSDDDEEDDAEVVDVNGYDISAQFNKLTIDPKYFGGASNFALAIERPQRLSAVWDVFPWERDSYEQTLNYVYPDPDLISSLLYLYFHNFHPTLPVLHQPTFERSVREGLHLRDPQFGALLLVVLANASRFSNDPRVYADGRSPLSSGWKFVRQIPVARKFFEPTLYEVQFYMLMTIYTIGTSRPQAAWTYLGLGSRYLQQRGQHRYKREKLTTQELEEWNRTFWTYLCVDRTVCAFIGRPTGLHPEDIDADPPLTCDDECWESGFIQPADKPSLNDYLPYFVQLSEVLQGAIRRLYSSKRSKMMQGSDGREWEQRMVTELESRLNKCMDSVPPHLRWDPENFNEFTDIATFDQSFVLYANSHYIRIVIYRPYIGKANVLAAPSLSICTNSARVVIRTVDAWVRARNELLPQIIVSSLFVSTIMLVMFTFSQRTSGALFEKDKAAVVRAMEILKDCTQRRQSEGRLWEMLSQLQSDNSPLSRRDAGAANSGSFGLATPLSTSVAGQMLQAGPADGASVPKTQTVPASGWHTPCPFDPEAPPLPAPEVASTSLNTSTSVTIEQLLAETADYALPLATDFSPSMGFGEDIVMTEDVAALFEAVPSDFSDIVSWGTYMRQHNTQYGGQQGWNLDLGYQT